MIEAIAVVGGSVAIAVMFKKQIKGIFFYARGKIEKNLPIEARIDRTISDLKKKQTNISYTVKELMIARKLMERQLQQQLDNPERAEKIRGTLEKFDSQIEKSKAIDVKIGGEINKLTSEKSYVSAMQATSKYTKFTEDELFEESIEIFAEIEAIEMLLSNRD